MCDPYYEECPECDPYYEECPIDVVEGEWVPTPDNAIIKYYPLAPTMTLVAGLLNYWEWKDYEGDGDGRWLWAYSQELISGAFSLTVWSMKDTYPNLARLDTWSLVLANMTSMFWVNRASGVAESSGVSTLVAYLLHMASAGLSGYVALNATPTEPLEGEIERDEWRDEHGRDEDGMFDIDNGPFCDPNMEICPEF